MSSEWLNSGRETFSFRVNGFTIMEVMVGMLLTAIGGVIAFMALGMSERRMNDFAEITDENIGVNQFLSLFEQDFSACNEAFVHGDYLELIDGNKVVNYQFSDGWIIRECLDRSDTLVGYFSWKTSVYEPSYVGTSVNEPSFAKASAGKIVDGVEIDLKYYNESLKCNWIKEYGNLIDFKWR